MDRELEPELMDSKAQAEAYANSDFSEPHNAFVTNFREIFPDFFTGKVADLGCGTADITLRFAKAYTFSSLIGIDGSEEMLEFGRQRIAQEHYRGHSIGLVHRMLPDHGQIPGSFDAVISNSLLHHLPNGEILWTVATELALPEAPIFVVDLTRPATVAKAEELVTQHSEGAPELMKRDFYNSLLAAFRPEEVRVQLDKLGLTNFKIQIISDRHMMIYGKNPKNVNS